MARTGDPARGLRRPARGRRRRLPGRATLRVLLDAHALLWALADDDALTEDARRVLRDSETDVYASAALAPLSITTEHAIAAARLPPHHADPFDRVLVAQALFEDLTLVTSDARLAEYGVAILPAS